MGADVDHVVEWTLSLYRVCSHTCRTRGVLLRGQGYHGFKCLVGKGVHGGQFAEKLGGGQPNLCQFHTQISKSALA